MGTVSAQKERYTVWAGWSVSRSLWLCLAYANIISLGYGRLLFQAQWELFSSAPIAGE